MLQEATGVDHHAHGLHPKKAKRVLLTEERQKDKEIDTGTGRGGQNIAILKRSKNEHDGKGAHIIPEVLQNMIAPHSRRQRGLPEYRRASEGCEHRMDIWTDQPGYSPISLNIVYSIMS